MDRTVSSCPAFGGNSNHSTFRRSALSLVVALGLMASAASPVAAQDPPPSSSTTTTVPTSTTSTTKATTSTTAAPTSTTATSTSTTAAGNGSTTSTTSSTVPVPEPVCAPITEGAGSSESIPADPDASEEEPPCTQPLFDIDGDGILDEVTTDVDPGQTEDEVDGPPPSVNVTIPPPNRFDNAIEWTPSVALVSDLETATAKFDAADAALTRIIATVRSFRLQQKRIEGDREALDQESLATIIALEQAEQRLRLRATNAFVDGDEMSFDAAEGFGQVPDDQAQQTVVDIVFETDRALIASHEANSSAQAAETRRLIQRTRLLGRSLLAAERSVDDAEADLEQASRELEAFEAGSGVYISGVTFPIAWPYGVPLINSWGFPRSGGRRHEGIDIFAAAGTPLVAAERGVVTRIGNGTLGGLRLWLRGESGTDWYYAHLSAFAPGLHENQLVEVGELVGYVGNTGNAVGTPPHLHMQIHPNGGDPVNPYPLLKLVSDDEIEARSVADAE